MKRSAGFTLIELIIVIVILGILAVTAAPKFINLQGDARTSTVNGLKGAVQAVHHQWPIPKPLLRARIRLILAQLLLLELLLH